jgi:uncharacterized protein (TIGR03546 family)
MVAQALAGENSPRQLAFGFALGMMIGLLPKGNLIALSLTLALFGARVNVGAGLIAAVLFSWLGVYFDPAADDLGHWLLGAPSLRGVWTSLYNLPLMRWSGFNNTVVLGSLGLGLVLFYPVYEISRYFFIRAQPRLAKWIGKHKFARALFGVELAANWRVG